jgi:hypothetical protein
VFPDPKKANQVLKLNNAHTAKARQTMKRAIVTTSRFLNKRKKPKSRAITAVGICAYSNKPTGIWFMR